MSLEKYCYDGKKEFKIKDFNTSDDGEFEDRSEALEEFINNLREINTYQQKLYAERKEGLIFVFQAMDAAGKDGVIRTVFSTLTPHGVREYCFKTPSTEELNHDFLWRFWNALPARGNISIFNRSYYEDVLIGKVHKLYKNQILPKRITEGNIIKMRYDQINDYENYLYNTGTRVIKIFLNVSKDEQAKRFISRIDTPKKNWKISVGDIEERKYWDDYMDAFEKMINVTSTKECPWYVVPADHKWYARLVVSRIVLKTLKDMNPDWPDANSDGFEELRKDLYDSLNDKNLDKEEIDEIFASPNILVEDELEKEEKNKIKEKEEKIKKCGFDAVINMIEKGEKISSKDDIVNAIAREMRNINRIKSNEEKNNSRKENDKNGK